MHLEINIRKLKKVLFNPNTCFRKFIKNNNSTRRFKNVYDRIDLLYFFLLCSKFCNQHISDASPVYQPASLHQSKACLLCSLIASIHQENVCLSICLFASIFSMSATAIAFVKTIAIIKNSTEIVKTLMKT